MIGVYYTNYRGGTNNLAVAVDTATGEAATSLKGKEQAKKALRRKLSKRRMGK